MNSLYKLMNKKNDKFHMTKILLKIYRKVVWRVEEAVCEVDETAYEFGGRRISELIDFLSFELDEFDTIKDKKTIQERLMSIAESKSMIEIVDKALLKLKTHPDNGEIYFNIITSCYINKEKLSDNQIMYKYNISESTYYRYKKKAINLMGVILWGYILPSLREAWLINDNQNKVADNQSAYCII